MMMKRDFVTYRPGGICSRTLRTSSREMLDFPFLVEALYSSQTSLAKPRSFSFPLCWLFLPPRPINTLQKEEEEEIHIIDAIKEYRDACVYVCVCVCVCVIF